VAALEAPQQQQWRGPRWTLAVGCLTLKGGRTDWLVEKATELGAHSVVPLITERSQAAGATKFKVAPSSKQRAAEEAFQPGRLQRLAIAATKQSLRVHALQLAPPTALADLLGPVGQAPLALLATAGAPPAGAVLAAALSKRAGGGQGGANAALAALSQQPCYLFVGPEGDFTPEEVAALTAAGALPVGLGANRLRTETAAVALLAAAAAYADAAALAAGGVSGDG
jgi:16S rRNA (uracil1498-N3)-methyltransferase